jgi:[ribosomal protein S5]-alanine N-acetyltransferase
MKVVLRKWKRSDADELAKIANNKNIADNLRDLFPHPYKKKNAREWIERVKHENPQTNFCVDVDGAVAGSIGFMLKEDVYRKNVEIGYFIGEEFWGQGVATEAVRQLVDHIAKNFEAIRIYAEVFEHNKASMRALEKNGFHLEGIRKKSVIKNGVVMDDQVWVKLLK